MDRYKPSNEVKKIEITDHPYDSSPKKPKIAERDSYSMESWGTFNLQNDKMYIQENSNVQSSRNHQEFTIDK